MAVARIDVKRDAVDGPVNAATMADVIEQRFVRRTHGPHDE
jgi:hypothetical protein